MNFRRQTPLAILIAFVFFQIPKVVFGLNTDTGEAVVPVVAMMVSMEDEAKSLPIIRAVQGQLSDLSVSFRLVSSEQFRNNMVSQLARAREVAMENNAMAVFWCVFTKNNQVLLFLSDNKTERLLVRRLTGPEGEGYAEEFAIIVRASIIEMRKGGEIGVSVASIVGEVGSPSEQPWPPKMSEMPVSKPRMEPKNAGAKQRSVFLEVAYQLLLYNSDHLVVNGLFIGSGIKLKPDLYANIGYTFFSTIEKAGKITTLRVDRHPIQVGIGMEKNFGRVEFGVRVNLIIDYPLFRNVYLSNGVVSTSESGHIALSLLTGGRALVRLNEILGFFLIVGTEIELLSRHYVARSETGDELLIDSWPVHPLLLAGITAEII